MQVEERIPIVKILRFCRRCERWRSIGNFTVGRYGRVGKTCHLCWRKGAPNANRHNRALTDKGRAAVAEMAEAANGAVA